MDLRSDTPYWLMRHGIVNSYPSLSSNLRCEIVVIGAGISGALSAWKLAQAGHQVVVVDRRHVGMGSTSASTGLLQYEIDTPLHKLAEKVGEKNAIRSYILCRNSIDEIENINDILGLKGMFNKRPSFQYASYKKDISGLQKELAIRKKAGLHLEWIGPGEIIKKFGFEKSGGLLSADGGDIDAYAFTHAVLKDAIRLGAKLYDHTTIDNIQHNKNGVELTTSGNYKIKAQKLVIACGYESKQYIPKKVQQLHSTYAIISEEKAFAKPWWKEALIWETAQPYLYLRTTSDQRIIIGGKDSVFSDPIKRDALLPQKAKDLEKAFNKLFPKINFKTDFKWAGSFASTKDGLPYIGSIPERPHTFFALGYGGNGITFSVIAAQLIADELAGKKNEDKEIFSFNR